MSDNHHNPSDHQPHVMPLSMYFGVASALIVLTVVTVWTAKYMPETILHFTKMQITPTISIIIAMLIACFKAALVCAFFMHLKYDKPLNRLVFFSGLFFLSLFFIFTLADMLTRADTPTVAITDTMPEHFKGLTERAPTPVWVPAWHGYEDDGHKKHDHAAHKGHAHKKGEHNATDKEHVDHKDESKGADH